MRLKQFLVIGIKEEKLRALYNYLKEKHNSEHFNKRPYDCFREPIEPGFVIKHEGFFVLYGWSNSDTMQHLYNDLACRNKLTLIDGCVLVHAKSGLEPVKVYAVDTYGLSEAGSFNAYSDDIVFCTKIPSELHEIVTDYFKLSREDFVAKYETLEIVRWFYR